MREIEHGVSAPPTISVIIPVYNAEKYLRSCIDSVLAQTYKDFELLLIDDGSKDSSGVICDEYAAQDARVRVFHKENGGVSSARNLGLDNAQGKYLMFLDSDDFWLQDDVLEVLVGKAEENDLDIIRGEYSAMHEDGTLAWNREISAERKNHAGQILTNVEFLEYAIHGENFLFLSLFKRSSIGSLRFEVGRVFLEDMLFYSTYFLHSLRCMYVPIFRFYAYRKNEGSISSQISVKKLADSFSMCYRFHELAEHTQGELRRKYIFNSIMMYYWTLSTVASKPYYSSHETIIDTLYLKKLQKDILGYVMANRFINWYLPVFMVSPVIGVYLIHIKNCIVCTLHNIFKYR